MSIQTRRTLVLTAIAAAFIAVCGAAAAETAANYDPNAIINVGSTNPPVSLNNIAGGSSGITEALYGNVYEPLLRLEDDGRITPDLASSFKVSADGLTYTFAIRKGVKFHDGSALSAEDVKFSFDRTLSAESRAARKADLAVIDSVKASGDEVVVTLKQRAQSFPYFATFVWVLKSGATGTESAANGTGPYRLADYQAGTSLSLERFDGYWGDKPKNKTVVFSYFNDASAETNALASGQIDIITNVDNPEQLKAFKGNRAYSIAEGKSTTKQVLAFNDQRKPFTDPRVRRAISSAIDKAALLKAAWDGYGQLIGSFVPPQDPWFEDLTSVNAYDPKKASALLAEAGYPKGFAFSLITPATSIHQLSAQAIKKDLAKIGVTVDIKVIDPSAWYDIVFKNKNFDATLQEHVNDRDLVWYGNPAFYWGYDNAEVQQWVKDAQSVGTAAEQNAVYKKIGRKIAEDAASSWLFLYPQLRVSSSKVSGYPVNGKNSSFFLSGIQKKK